MDPLNEINRVNQFDQVNHFRDKNGLERQTSYVYLCGWWSIYPRNVYVVVRLSVGLTLLYARSRPNPLFDCCVTLTRSAPSNKKMMATFGKISSRAWINGSGTSYSCRTYSLPLALLPYSSDSPATHAGPHIKSSSTMSSMWKHT